MTTRDTQSEFESRLVASPCCLPKLLANELYPEYQRLGFSKFEAFSSWAACRLDWTGDPEEARREASSHGLEISSFHLPPIEDDAEESYERVLSAMRYAVCLGAKVALLKARRKELFGTVGVRLLDALDKENLSLTLALQNHAGSSISTLEDYRQVFDLMNSDKRIKAVLEVGHFQRVGVHWRDGWNLLAGRIALIHVNEIREGKSVHYGTGEVDFSGLMAHIKKSGYGGNIVVELGIESRNTDTRETLDGLAKAKALLTTLYRQA